MWSKDLAVCDFVRLDMAAISPFLIKSYRPCEGVVVSYFSDLAQGSAGGP